MVRTMLITTDYPPMVGGVANYWANLARYLDPEQLVVLAGEMENSLDFDVREHYLIYRRSLISGNKLLWPRWLPAIYHAWQLARMEKIQKIIITQVLPMGTVALLIKKFLNIPYIVSLHGLDIASASRNLRKKKIAERILNNAEKIIVNSEFTKGLLLQSMNIIEKDKVVVVYPCPNIVGQEIEPEKLNDFKLKNGLIGKKIILAVSRLVKRKGQDMVIKALTQVLPKVPDLAYLIVGNGPELEPLKNLVKDNKLESQVKFFNDVSDKDLGLFYAVADLFVMASRKLSDGDIEGFGIVYLEANAFGKPVIAGNVGGAPEAVRHNQTGLIVDPENVNEIAQAIISLLTNSEKSKQLGANGKKMVAEMYNWPKQSQKLINILN